MKKTTLAAILAATLSLAGGLAIADNDANNSISDKASNAVNATTDAVSKAANKTGQAISDGTIQSKIAIAYKMDGDLDASAITISVKNGTVNLNGTVPTKEEVKAAKLIAKDVKGVKEVHNNLKVAKPAPDSSSADMKTTAIDTKTTAVIIGKLIKEYKLDTSNVHVNTTDKTVTLTGSVKSDADRQKVENIVKKTKDVSSVDNQLTVEK